MTKKNEEIHSVKMEEDFLNSSGIEEPESLQTNEETEQKDYQQSEKLPSNSDVLDLLASFEKMKIEERRLLETKQQLLAQQYALRNKLVEEIEKKKESIANLNSEIPDIENRNKQLRQALNEDIYNKTHPPKIDSPILIDAKGQQDLHECVGLLSCQKPEKCSDYDSCLKKYLAAEMRNEDLKL